MKARLRDAAREEILQAAERVLGERGLAAARMDEIALAAGVAVGTLYNHFGDKEALLGALLDERRDELLARVDEALEVHRAEPFSAQLTAFLGAAVEHLAHHRRLFAMLVEDELRSGRQRAKGKTTLEALSARCEGLVERGVREGVLRPEDAALYPAFLLGGLRGLYARFSRPGEEPAPDVVPALVRLFLEGARR